MQSDVTFKSVKVILSQLSKSFKFILITKIFMK